MTATNPFQPYVDMMGAFLPAGLFAPQQLSQAILPGWSLISVNQGNSSAPETEQAVVAKASYGRQLGRIMEALEVVIDATPPPLSDAQTDEKKAIAEFRKLAEEVRQTKKDAAAARAERMIDDLKSLRLSNPDEFRERCDALKAFLKDPG